jgi:hypothetical protein
MAAPQPVPWAGPFALTEAAMVFGQTALERRKSRGFLAHTLAYQPNEVAASGGILTLRRLVAPAYLMNRYVLCQVGAAPSPHTMALLPGPFHGQAIDYTKIEQLSVHFHGCLLDIESMATKGGLTVLTEVCFQVAAGEDTLVAPAAPEDPAWYLRLLCPDKKVLVG